METEIKYGMTITAVHNKGEVLRYKSNKTEGLYAEKYTTLKEIKEVLRNWENMLCS